MNERCTILVVEKRRTVEMAKKQIILAEKTHEMTNKQYQVGIATGLDLLYASSDLSNRRIKQVFEQLQYDLALLGLRKTVGEYSSLSNVPQR